MEFDKFRTIAIKTLGNFTGEDGLENIKDKEELTNLNIDSMKIMEYLTCLESELEKNLDIEKFEAYGFSLSLETIFKVFFTTREI